MVLLQVLCKSFAAAYYFSWLAPPEPRENYFASAFNFFLLGLESQRSRAELGYILFNPQQVCWAQGFESLFTI